jgi:hypothetical protein
LQSGRVARFLNTLQPFIFAISDGESAVKLLHEDDMRHFIGKGGVIFQGEKTN